MGKYSRDALQHFLSAPSSTYPFHTNVYPLYLFFFFMMIVSVAEGNWSEMGQTLRGDL